MNLSINKINLFDEVGSDVCRVFRLGKYATSTARWFNARYFR